MLLLFDMVVVSGCELTGECDFDAVQCNACEAQVAGFCTFVQPEQLRVSSVAEGIVLRPRMWLSSYCEEGRDSV